MIEALRASAQRAQKTDAIGFLARFAPLIFLIVLMVGFSVAEPRFLSPFNLFNVLRQVSIYGLLAVGMTFVILTAGIDLSIGSLVAFCGLVAAAVAKGGVSNRFSVGAGQERFSSLRVDRSAGSVQILFGGDKAGSSVKCQSRSSSS
jgi:inositol transport system permease protein